MSSFVRIVVPDSHGEHIDLSARNAFLADVKRLRPRQIVMVGDHVDCGGTFNGHQRTYTNEMEESYADDCDAANEFLDLLQERAPEADVDYIFGNHEVRVEKWAAEQFLHRKDAEAFVERQGPAAALLLKKRGIRWYTRSQQYMGIKIPGTIRLGKCFFTHGIGCSKNAAQMHLDRFGDNVVFGHVHRSLSVIGRSVTSDAFGAWSPGTLAKIQPLWRHTTPTDWTHGYGVQFVNKSGLFVHVNVPIVNGKSLLLEVASAVA